MKILRAQTSTGIKSDRAQVVKQRKRELLGALTCAELAFSFLIFIAAMPALLATQVAYAADPSQSSEPSPKPSDDPSLENLPDIEAKVFKVKVLDRTRSYRTYMVEADADPLPQEGRILMIRHDGKNAMGVRIVKSYPEQKQIAITRIQVYYSYRVLDLEEKYDAILKVYDLTTITPTEKEKVQDKEDLRELEGKSKKSSTPTSAPAAAPSNSSDSSANSATDQAFADSPRPSTPAIDPAQGDEDGDDHLGLSIEETTQLDPYRFWVTGALGFMLNNPIGGGGYFYKGGGFRFGYDLTKEFFLKKTHLQDSITVEGGAFLYSAVGTTSDSFTVMPLEALLRYNVFFSEGFALFVDVGFMQNIVLTAGAGSDANASKVDLQNLGSTVIAAGAGMLFRVGPGWFLRFDAGIDFIGAGLVLRF